MKDGVHELEFALTGSCLIGVAAARPDPEIWSVAAWGLNAPNGGVVSIASAISGQYAGHANVHAADDEERRVKAIVDMVTRRLSFVTEREGLIDSRVRLPRAVRPWACFPEGGSAPASARIVSHRRVAVPTARIAGLTALVGKLPVQTQALALAWCDENGVADVADIGATGQAEAFAEMTRVVIPADEALVARGEAASWASASAKRWAGWS